MPFKKHLSKDKKLKKLVDSVTIRTITKKKNIFTYLCASIISQQLSVKVAIVIHQRYLDLFGGKEPSPQQVLDMPNEKLRAVGLSNAKVNYVKNVAQFELEQGMALAKLNKMDDEQVIDYLTQIKGVGRWTVEMLLMFALKRENVFAVDDLGIQIAMTKLYGWKTTDKKIIKQKMLKQSKLWEPYKTYACLYLWDWKDNAPKTI